MAEVAKQVCLYTVNHPQPQHHQLPRGTTPEETNKLKPAPQRPTSTAADLQEEDTSLNFKHLVWSIPHHRRVYTNSSLIDRRVDGNIKQLPNQG